MAALRGDDLDRAMDLGLLDADGACAGCGDACRALLEAARDARMRAFAARERYRQRSLRLERREQERIARRAPVLRNVASATAERAPGARTAPPALPPTLPPAAAAALARAKARAAGRT